MSTFDEQKAQLQQLVAAGEITQEQADEILSSLNPSALEISNRSSIDRLVDSIDPQKDLLNEFPQFEGKVASATDEELQFQLQNQSNSPELISQIENEIINREKLSEAPFLEAIQTPGYAERFARTAIKGPAQTVNAITTGFPGLANLAVGTIFDNDVALDAAQNSFENFAENNQNLNNFFGVSNPLRPEESLAESLTGALVPGGILTKAGGIATDFLADQTIRELTDNSETTYQTVFDELGLTNDTVSGGLEPLAAIAAGILTTSLSAATVKRLITTKLTPNTQRQISDIDPSGPENLTTIERSSDATMATVVDEQDALINLARRAGIPNFDEVKDLINMNTLLGAQTRVQEALRNGILSNSGTTFKPQISPRALYDSYRQLPQNERQVVAEYVNILDMIDDAKIAITRNIQGNHQQVITQLTAKASAILQQFPIVKEFSKSYNDITAQVRNFLDGNLLTNAQRQALDQNRSNYVPLQMQDIDPDAPFMRRVSQARQDAVRTNQQQFEETFLLTRQSTGNYDIARRSDPFDLMLQYTESALVANLRNTAQRAYIDGLLSSTEGASTIRRITKEEKGKWPEREISIRRDGKVETYLTSRLQAQLLRFDPSFMQMPAFFIPKRIAEQSAVGPLSVVFAPVTAIRDTIAGAVLRPKEVTAPSALNVAAAVPQQLWAKAQNAFKTSIDSALQRNSTLFPEWIMDRQSQILLSDRIGNSYTNTLYHLANTQGGFDASLMRNRIELGQGVLREVKRSVGETLDASQLTQNSAVKLSSQALRASIDGFIALFDAIQDAPRFAAMQRTFEDTGDLASSTVNARKLTGDTTRGGRSYSASDNVLTADATDDSLLNFLNPTIAKTANFARESTPFFNPMIQGTRRLLESFADDPIGTNMRAFQYVGLPAIAAYGWNEMFGKEYNDYAMNRRSSYDVAMSMYFAVPGKPPEEGIEIPLPHELLFFNSPFTRSLHGLSRGETGDQLSASLSNLSNTILQNSVDVGFPTTLAIVMNSVGVNAPDSIFRPTDGVYKIREDEIGFLDQNVEAIVKTLFTSVGDTALRSAYSLSRANDEQGFEAFVSEAINNTLRRTPIVKNLTGRKNSNVRFSLPREYSEQRFNALETFRTYYDAFFNPKRFSDAGLEKLGSRDGFTNPKGLLDSERDLPFRMIGPELLEKPTNNLIEEFGSHIVNTLQRNDLGMSGAQDRVNNYSKLISNLRNYTIGDQEAIAEWQQRVQSATNLEEDDKKLIQLLEEGDYDLSNYDDRINLINDIEIELSYIIGEQLDLMDEVEATFNDFLRVQGRLPEGERFNLQQHLKPFIETPFPAIEGQNLFGVEN